MTKHPVAFQTISLIASFIILASCSSQRLTDPKLEHDTTPTITTIIPTNEIETSTPTPTVLPPETPVPSPTPIKWPIEPITAENAGSLKEINRWGRGSVIRIQKLDNKQDEYLVLTPLGLY